MANHSLTFLNDVRIKFRPCRAAIEKIGVASDLVLMTVHQERFKYSDINVEHEVLKFSN